jgi:manganese/zinc/iron transport system permease protein
VVVSLLAAPRRGLAWQALRARRQAARVRVGAVLGDLRVLAAQHGDVDHGHSAAVLRLMRPGGAVEGSLEELERRGWARRTGQDDWALTEAGRDEAERREGERS